MTTYPAQLQPFTLAGSGNAIGDTTLVLSSFNDIKGVALTMASFGSKGYGTLEPANGTQEESMSFTGITPNANGTVTLTGVSTVLFLQPFTETSGLTIQHPGGATFIISNTSAYENQNSIVGDNETITGLWTFPNNANTPQLGASYVAPTLPNQIISKQYADNLAIAGAPNASTSVQGLVQLPTNAQVLSKTATGSTGAKLALTPDLQASTLLSDYVIDTGTANAYAITPSPAITAYAVGQIFSFKATHTNTGASTLNVNALGTKNIFKNGQFALVAGDIKNGAIVQVEYDGTQFQLVSPSSLSPISQTGAEIYASSTTGTTAYIVGYTPAVTQYVTGLTLNFKTDTNSQGGATLNVNSLGAKSIVKNVNQTLNLGDIKASQVSTVIYDGTNFQLMSKPNVALTFNSGQTTYDTSTASGTQTIAHGLNGTPNRIKLTGYQSNGGLGVTTGTYDGITNHCVASSYFSAAQYNNNSDSYAIYFRMSVSGTEASQTGVVTVNATNISIAWTKLNSPTGTALIFWEAQLNS